MPVSGIGLGEVTVTGGGGGGGDLQDAYDVGNSIVVTTPKGSFTVSNSTDITDTITVSRTFAGAGVGIAVNMAAGTTGSGLRIVAAGSGPGVEITGGATDLTLGVLGADYALFTAAGGLGVTASGLLMAVGASGSGLSGATGGDSTVAAGAGGVATGSAGTGGGGGGYDISAGVGGAATFGGFATGGAGGTIDITAGAGGVADGGGGQPGDGGATTLSGGAGGAVGAFGGSGGELNLNGGAGGLANSGGGDINIKPGASVSGTPGAVNIGTVPTQGGQINIGNTTDWPSIFLNGAISQTYNTPFAATALSINRSPTAPAGGTAVSVFNNADHSGILLSVQGAASSSGNAFELGQLGSGKGLNVIMGAATVSNAVTLNMTSGASGEALEINDGTDSLRLNLVDLRLSQSFTFSTDDNAAGDGSAGFGFNYLVGNGANGAGAVAGGGGGGIGTTLGIGGTSGSGLGGLGGSFSLIAGVGGISTTGQSGDGGGANLIGGVGAIAGGSTGGNFAGLGGGATVRAGAGGLGLTSVPGRAGGETILEGGLGGGGTASALSGGGGNVSIAAGDAGATGGFGVGVQGSITFDALGSTTPIPFNATGADADLVGFTATSIVGALNELAGAGGGQPQMAGNLVRQEIDDLLLATETKLGSFTYNPTLFGSASLALSLTGTLTDGGGAAASFDLRLYDMGAPNTPIAPVLRSVVTFGTAGSLRREETALTLDPAPGVDADEIHDVERIYEVRGELTGDVGDLMEIDWAGILGT